MIFVFFNPHELTNILHVVILPRIVRILSIVENPVNVIRPRTKFRKAAFSIDKKTELGSANLSIVGRVTLERQRFFSTVPPVTGSKMNIRLIDQNLFWITCLFHYRQFIHDAHFNRILFSITCDS